MAKGFTEDEVLARIATALAQAHETHEASLKEAQTRFGRQVQELSSKVAEHQAAYTREVETEIAKLSSALAEKILQHELRLQPSALASRVRGALGLLHPGQAITLHVPQSELSIWKAIESDLGSQHQWQITPDPALKAGDLTVDTGQGTACLGVREQLKELETVLLGRIDEIYSMHSVSADVLSLSGETATPAEGQ